MFIFLLLCNCLTPYQADDFYYHFRIDNGELVKSVADIVPSMVAHAEVLNGRLVAHSLVQLFEMLPKIIFNIINSAMLIALVALIRRYIGFGVAHRSAWDSILVFAALWVFTPAAGEVYLWLDGSINYLWAIVANLVFLLPYFVLFFDDKVMTGKAKKIGFVLFAFLCGAFQETASTAAFLLSVVFMILVHHNASVKKINWVYIAGAVASFAGLLFMATRSAELSVKSSSGSFINLYIGFTNAMSFFLRFAPGIGVYVVSFTLCIINHADKKKITASMVFFIGFLCAIGVMILARIFPDRCSAPALVFLVMANAVTLLELSRLKYKTVFTCFAVLLCTAFVYFAVLGMADITSTFAQFKANESTILAAVEAGEDGVRLPCLYATTKYSVAHAMTFPSTLEWVNQYMAEFYGIGHIEGYDLYSSAFSG